MSKTFINITDVAELSRIFERKESGQIILCIEGLSPDDADRWQRRLNDSYLDCGCSTGTAFILAFFGVYLLSIFFRLGHIPWPWWTEALIGFTVFFGSAGLGKFIGLRNARRRFQKAVKELEGFLSKNERGQTSTEATHNLTKEALYAVR